MWCSDLFNELVPVCSGCQRPFDMRCGSPQILPCSHTLCLACVTSESKVRKSGKRRCLTCDTKYTKTHLNTALGETIERIRVRREALESQSRRCDECEKRAYISWMRRCITCEIQLKEAQLTSVICMECCVDRHNGHALRVVTADVYVHKDDKVGHSISICGSTTSTQYRSSLSGHSSTHSPRLQSSTRLHSTSSASSGFSSGGIASSPGENNSIATSNFIGITQKMSSLLSRVTTRSDSLPPHHSPIQGKASMLPLPVDQNQEGKRNLFFHQPSPPTVILPMVPSPSVLRGRGTFRPGMATLSPYLTPNRGGVSSLKRSLDDLDDAMPKGEIIREEMSPFYEGQSLYGMSVAVDASRLPPHTIQTVSSLDRSFPLPRSQVEMRPKRASLPITDGDYHRLSPCTARRSPITIPFPKASISSGGGTVKVQSPLAAMANMPRRDPRIRGGPAYLHDSQEGPQYENEQRLSLHSTGSSTGGEGERRGDTRGTLVTNLSPATFFDKHMDNDKMSVVTATVHVESPHPQYINVTRSCENLPSQCSKLDMNNNDGDGRMRRGVKFPFRSALLNNLSDHCCSYEYIGS